MPDITTLGAVIKSTYEGQSNTNAFTDVEKSKLSGIQAGAEVNTVDSVNGQTGAVSLLIPTTLSQLTNDVGFITSSSVPTALSQLSNDTNFITSAEAPVQSVSGKTGVVTLDSSDVGLDNVDNTSDADKPVSTATQTALDGKPDSDPTGVTGADAITNIISLTQAEYDGIGSPDASTLYVIVG